MDRGAWQATVHWVAKSWTQLRTQLSTHTLTTHSMYMLFHSIFSNTYLLNSNCVLWKFSAQEDWITVNNLRNFRSTVKPASRGLYLGLYKTQGFEDSAKHILMKGHNLQEGLQPLLFYHMRAFWSNCKDILSKQHKLISKLGSRMKMTPCVFRHVP